MLNFLSVKNTEKCVHGLITTMLQMAAMHCSQVSPQKINILITAPTFKLPFSFTLIFKSIYCFPSLLFLTVYLHFNCSCLFSLIFKAILAAFFL